MNNKTYGKNGYGFDLPKVAVAPSAPRKTAAKSEDEIAA
jgi:hypothetical protein